ncbi:MAG: hypothetical protein RI516_04605 [Spiribacter sp.]|jgi:hypothetical protein|nr:hypothetical protein [Spiribacter sp.]MDR9480608.1 hypothetical protein [Spiribacter sp.]
MDQLSQQRRRVSALLGLLMAVLLLSGCYEEMDDVHLYDPGVYKGQTDPLMSKSGTDALTQPLAERLRAGQTDR